MFYTGFETQITQKYKILKKVIILHKHNIAEFYLRI